MKIIPDETSNLESGISPIRKQRHRKLINLTNVEYLKYLLDNSTNHYLTKIKYKFLSETLRIDPSNLI